ncbi:MAG: serine protease, partial [Paracoccaceae bacterium]
KVEAYLADHLRPLANLTDDEVNGDLVRAVLSVADEDFVRVIGDNPVIFKWGLQPGNSAGGSNAKHVEKSMGKYLAVPGKMGPAALAGTGDAANNSAAASQSVGGGASEPPIAVAAAPEREPLSNRRAISTIAWVPLVVLLLLSGAFLAWLWLPESRLFPHHAQKVAVTDEYAESAVVALNESLTTRRDALKEAIAGAVCRADGTLVLPDGKTPDGLLPYSPRSKEGAPGKASAVPPDAILPSHASRIVVPDPTVTVPEGGSVEEISKITLSNLIEARTVLVLAVADGALELGSGLSVGPGLIVTNNHVVEAILEKGGGVYVVNKTLEKPSAAKVIKSVGPLDQAGADFALLKIENETLPAFSILQPENTLKLNNVVAAGFPADVLATDIGFASLTSGNATAMPELTMTDGTINTEQQIGPQTTVLMHSAALSSGNSGGPLVDMCGRLVGVNTFVRKGKMQNRGFALATADLQAFLQGTDAKPQVVTTVCEPVVLRPGASTTAEAKSPDASKDGKADEKPAEPAKE